jgi:hypothetical protein
MNGDNNKEYYDKMGITEDYLFKIMKIKKWIMKNINILVLRLKMID